MSESENYGEQVDGDFLGELEDSLSTIEVLIGNIRSGIVSGEDGVDRISAETSRLQQISYSADQPLVDLTLRRLNNYIDFLEQMTEQRLFDIESFVDILRGIQEGEIQSDTNEAEFVRSLPVLRPVEIEDLEHLDLEILLVDRQRSSARMFERELRSCGYRVNISLRSFDALEQAVRTLPDMIISSSELDDMNGADLCLALRAIPKTSQIPFAILTSYDRGHGSLKTLPDSAMLISKGPEFGEGLAKALNKFKLT